MSSGAITIELWTTGRGTPFEHVFQFHRRQFRSQTWGF